MSNVLCPHCNAPSFSPVGDCAYCGGELRYLYAAPAEVWSDAPEIALHPMGLTKLALLSLTTLGLYNIWWFARNWRLRNELRGRGVTAPLRALFSPLFAYSLFEDVDEEVRSWGVTPGWNTTFLGIIYFLLHAITRLPDPWWLFGLGSFVVLLPVQDAINQANAASERPAPVNDRYSIVNIAWIVVGGLLLLLAVLGTLFPDL